MVGILVATLLLVASETEGVVTTATCICKKREPQEPLYITWAGEPSTNLCSFQSRESFFS